MRHSERLKVRRNIAHVMGKKAGSSLSIDLETQEIECQHEMAVRAPSRFLKLRGGGKLEALLAWSFVG